MTSANDREEAEQPVVVPLDLSTFVFWLRSVRPPVYSGFVLATGHTVPKNRPPAWIVVGAVNRACPWTTSIPALRTARSSVPGMGP
jgi:hypothetical protein